MTNSGLASARERVTRALQNALELTGGLEENQPGTADDKPEKA